MLRQEELTFNKVIYNFQVPPAVLKDLRLSLSRRKKPLVPAGSRSTMPAGVAIVPKRSSRQLAVKRKADDLDATDDSSEPANERPARTGGTAPVPATATVTGEQVAICSRQLVTPRKG
jgi:hypothetical protein